MVDRHIKDEVFLVRFTNDNNELEVVCVCAVCVLCV